MNLNLEIFPSFPSPIIKFHVENDLKQIEDILKETEFAETFVENNPNFVSLDKRILEKCPEIKKILLDNFNKINDNILKYNADFEISTSWITLVNKGNFCQLHSHKNSFYSGVLYFGDYTEKSSQIEFEGPLLNHFDFFVLPKEPNLYNVQSFKILPEKNMLIFFPSYLRHRITKHLEDKKRYSLAFNIVPMGNYGSGDSQYDSSWVK